MTSEGPAETATSDDRFDATIISVRGKGSSPERGLPPLSEMTVSRPGAADLEVVFPKPTNAVDVTTRILHIVEPQEFSECPICLVNPADSREDVPPRAIGGTVLIRTCRECNSNFGGKVEPHLINDFDGAMETRFSSELVQGKRVTPRLLRRETPTGEFVLMFDNGFVDPAISTMLQGSKLEVQFTVPDPARIRLAILKSAYLGACLIMKEIPQSRLADAVRTELIAARDAPKNARLELSEHAQSLKVGRSYAPARVGEVGLGAVQKEDGALEYIVSLAGVLAVTWPLDPIQVTWEPAS